MYPAIPDSDVTIVSNDYTYTTPTFSIKPHAKDTSDKLQYAKDLLLERAIANLESAWMTPLELVAITKVITTMEEVSNVSNNKTLLSKLESKYSD